ncbi:MAG TPA: FlgD immunoglobulin-like domain containing protein [Candidatus Eisenbacteria bacterium]|jgi:hypothetical protein
MVALPTTLAAAAALLGALAVPGLATAADEIHWTITGQKSVTLTWRGGGPEALRYGTHPSVLNQVSAAAGCLPAPSSSPGPFWEARLTGLREDTRYYYRIGNQSTHTFRTPPPRGEADYWFAEEADVGSTLTWANVGITQAMIPLDYPNLPGDDRPRFVLVPGDLTYGDQETLADVGRHFNDVMAWSQDAAYMPAWGNHEWGTTADRNADNLNNYEGRFDLPNSKTSPGASAAVGNGPDDDWYWFDYGNVRFIAFPEPYTGAWSDWSVKVDPVMQEAQNDPELKFIVTFGHRPSWSSGADHGGDATLAGYMAALHATHSKYKLSLQAHSHHYERADPAQTGGILFIVGAGGGSTLGGLSSTRPSWSAFRYDHLEHLRLHVQDDRIDGYAICGPLIAGNHDVCVQGTVIDSFSVLADPAVGVDLPPPPGPRLKLSAEPNPALGSVAMVVEADAAGEQSLTVLDLSGRRVRHLGTGWRAGGVRRVLWDGKDDSGALAPPGVYQVSLRTGSRSVEARVALLR